MASSSSNLGSPISPVSTTHLERTAHEPRDPVRLNPNLTLIHLSPYTNRPTSNTAIEGIEHPELIDYPGISSRSTESP
jgi:hypothetical protein